MSCAPHSANSSRSRVICHRLLWKNKNERRDAYTRWKSGEISIIVATRAFGLGINKPDVRHVIRNGLPPSLAAWAQEFGRAGRDGKPAVACILYSDNDINHVGSGQET